MPYHLVPDKAETVPEDTPQDKTECTSPSTQHKTAIGVETDILAASRPFIHAYILAELPGTCRYWIKNENEDVPRWYALSCALDIHVDIA